MGIVDSSFHDQYLQVFIFIETLVGTVQCICINVYMYMPHARNGERVMHSCTRITRESIDQGVRVIG